MRELSFLVPEGYNGIVLRSFLRGYCGVSARLMIRLKREPMGITRNGAHAIVTELLDPGDVICLHMPEDEKQAEPVPVSLSVIFEDDDLLILDKPSGMPMYPSPGHDNDSLANAVAAYYLEQNEKIAFRPIYRLDKDTTGIVVLAKNSYTAARLAANIKKDYIAICEGELAGSGAVDGPIGLKEGHGIQREVTTQGERAVTWWYVLGVKGGHTLLRLELETGRTHQIRVHMSHIGHPLAGDDLYGGHLGLIHRQALHCGKIVFIHPYNNSHMHFECALPEDMTGLLGTCGIQYIQKQQPEIF